VDGVICPVCGGRESIQTHQAECDPGGVCAGCLLDLCDLSGMARDAGRNRLADALDDAAAGEPAGVVVWYLARLRARADRSTLGSTAVDLFWVDVGLADQARLPGETGPFAAVFLRVIGEGRDG